VLSFRVVVLAESGVLMTAPACTCEDEEEEEDKYKQDLEEERRLRSSISREEVNQVCQPCTNSAFHASSSCSVPLYSTRSLHRSLRNTGTGIQPRPPPPPP